MLIISFCYPLMMDGEICFFYKSLLLSLFSNTLGYFKLSQVEPCDLNIWLIPKYSQKISKIVCFDRPTKTQQLIQKPIKSKSLYDIQWLYLQIYYAYAATQTNCQTEIVGKEELRTPSFLCHSSFLYFFYISYTIYVFYQTNKQIGYYLNSLQKHFYYK